MVKCGFCNEDLASVDIEAITLTAPMGTPYRGLSYSCPKCRAVLSVGPDPQVLQDESVAALLAALRE
jgi:hypothetical protein